MIDCLGNPIFKATPENNNECGSSWDSGWKLKLPRTPCEIIELPAVTAAV